MTDKTAFTDGLPMPVYLGDHTDVVGKLNDLGVIVDMPNQKYLQIHTNRQDLTDQVEDILVMNLPVDSVQTTTVSIGQSRWGVRVDAQAVSLKEYITALQQVYQSLTVYE